MSNKKKPAFKLNKTTLITAVVTVIVLLVGNALGIFPSDDKGSGSNVQPTAAITAPQNTDIPQVITAPQNTDIPQVITAPQDIADYIFEHGELPDNFITKKEAQKMGWDSSKNDVSDVAPGKSIGGDRFGNYEGLLPDAPGRTWYEADANYTGGNRGAERIVFSNDGLVYYTSDHYESFTEMKPSK